MAAQRVAQLWCTNSMDFELSEEHRVFRDVVRRWVDAEIPKSWARELEKDEGNYPLALWDKFTEAGFHGIGIDEVYGGIGGDVLMQVILAREVSRSLAGLLLVWMPTSFAGAKSISLFGNTAQKERFLPSIAQGECRVSIGFTEPGGGTDVLGAMRKKKKKDLENSIDDYQKLLRLNNIIEKKFHKDNKKINEETKNRINKILTKKNEK